MYFFINGNDTDFRTEIRGMWFPEKPSLEKSSIAGSRTKDLTLCRPVWYYILTNRRVAVLKDLDGSGPIKGIPQMTSSIDFRHF